MNYVGKFFSNFKGFYNDINSATLTGAMDILVVRQEDGTYATSPWHVRFGKMGVIRAREKLASTSLFCQTKVFLVNETITRTKKIRQLFMRVKTQKKLRTTT